MNILNKGKINIIKIYEKYYLPERLQEHMLRVAACCNLIYDNLKESKKSEIDLQMLLRIALLHDMGNIAKISENDDEIPEFFEVRSKYVNKYGRDDHKINHVIGEAEGLTEKELDILDKKQLKEEKKIFESDDMVLKILAYCDQRVTPTGVDSLLNRLNELKIRHKNKPNGSMHDPVVADMLIEYAKKVENQVLEITNLKESDINDSAIGKYMVELRKFEI